MEDSHVLRKKRRPILRAAIWGAIVFAALSPVPRLIQTCAGWFPDTDLSGPILLWCSSLERPACLWRRSAESASVVPPLL